APETVVTMARTGKFPSITVGDQLRIRVEDVNRLVRVNDAYRVATPAERKELQSLLDRASEMLLDPASDRPTAADFEALDELAKTILARHAKNGPNRG